MRSTRAELLAYGCDMEPSAFEELLGETHADLFPAWTDEELADHLRNALDFCNVIRRKLKSDIPDDLIMRSLRNMRKQGRETSYSPHKASASPAVKALQ